MPLGTIQVPFPDSTFPGTHFQESGGRIINGYLEPLGPAAPSTIITRRAPGLRNFGTTTRTGFRGGIEVAGKLYAAFANRMVTFTSTGGVATDFGALTGTAKGFFARNNRFSGGTPSVSDPDIVFCDPDGNFAKWTTTTGIVNPYPMVPPFPDFPSPNSVCFLDGYFFYTIGDGRVFATDPLNSTNVQATSFANAESKPDGLIRGVPWAGQLFLFGPATTEVWSNAGTVPFPFQRAVIIPRGIAGPYCVSGFEDNFSRALVWVADDNTVVRLNGYTPEKISPPDLDGLIEKVPNESGPGSKRQLELSCFVSRGHAFLLLSSNTWSWVFDLNNNKWAERNTYLQQRSRITGGLFSFNKWLCGDILSLNVQEITNEVHTEAPTSQLVTGAVAGTSGRVRLTVPAATKILDDVVIVQGVLGTTEANGVWPINIIDMTHIELVGSVFTNAFAASSGIVSSQNVLPFRWRLESGAVENFPVGARVGRADFEFVTGVGIVSDPPRLTHKIVGPVFGEQPGTPQTGRIVLIVDNFQDIRVGDTVHVEGVLGTTEANGNWVVGNTIVNVVGLGPGIILNGTSFLNPYIGGGTVRNISTLEPNETDPVVEISWSDDGGQNYYAPIKRRLGRQANTRELVSLIACTGRSSWNARRWRIDIADPVYVGFMAAYQNQSPKVSDIG